MLLVASKYTWLLEDGIFHHFVFVALRTQVCWQLFIAYVPIQSFVIWKELHHIYLYGDKGHFSWCLVTKLLCLYFKFLLVQQKLFVKNRYCILQLMQWSSHLHPHGKRQCYLWVLYKVKFDDKATEDRFSRGFFKCSYKVKISPDYQKVPVHLSQTGTPLLVLLYYWPSKKRTYVSAQCVTFLVYSLNYGRI